MSKMWRHVNPQGVIRAREAAFRLSGTEFIPVTIVRRVKGGANVRDEAGEVSRVSEKELVLAEDATPVYRDYIAAIDMDKERFLEKLRQRRHEENIEQYIHGRTLATAPYVMYRSQWDMENRSCRLGPEYVKGDPDRGVRSYITVDASSTYFDTGIPRLDTVNWSALGSTTPEVAIQFADALRRAAEFAIKQREELEKALGIIIPQREDSDDTQHASEENAGVD